MLAIRLQRRGRKGLAQFRIIVQDSRKSPTSGRVVASLGSYDPHSKNITLDVEKAKFYLENGAQPSSRAVMILKDQKVDLPKWVADFSKKNSSIRNPDKLRKNQKAEEAPATEKESPEAETAPVSADEEKAKDTAAPVAEEPAKESKQADSSDTPKKD